MSKLCPRIRRVVRPVIPSEWCYFAVPRAVRGFCDPKLNIDNKALVVQLDWFETRRRKQTL